MRPEWCWHVKCCLILSVPTPTIFPCHMNVVITDHSGATAVCHVPALEFVILAPMRFLFVALSGDVGYHHLDRRIVHAGCGMITPHSSDVRGRIDHFGLAQCVAGCTSDTASAYLVYRRCTEIDWSSLRPSGCWFPYTFEDGRVHRLSATEVRSHKHTGSGEHAPPQILAAPFITRVVDRSGRCFIADAIEHLGSPPRSDEATPFVAPASPDVVIDVLHVDLGAKGD